MALISLARCALLAGLTGLAACTTTALQSSADAPDTADTLPAMRWDFRPEAETWTAATLDALEEHGTALSSTVPGDVDQFCPAYRTADTDQRNAFWAGLFSALAKHESTWNPRASGGGGLWLGLLQIDPRTARGYGCKAKTAKALFNGADNLSCGVRIAAVQVARRGSINRGMRDWGPFHSSSKRAEMAAWTSKQDYCQIKAKPKPNVTARLAALSATRPSKVVRQE